MPGQRHIFNTQESSRLSGCWQAAPASYLTANITMCLSGVAGRDNDRAKTRGDVPGSRAFGTDFGGTNDRNNEAG
jgi:hypothetical protein